MTVEILNTGTELLLGKVLNTNAQWLCTQLSQAGYAVGRQTTVPDDGPSIVQGVREALARAEVIIATGGLGPTSDDKTRDLLAAELGLQLVEDAEALENIQRFFAARKRPLPERTRVQALVPEGATVFQNAHGTAPGLAMEVKGLSPRWIVCLPGPPRELRPMFSNQVLPLLKQKFPLTNPVQSRTLLSTGIGESYVEDLIAAPLAPLVHKGLEIGYCARPGEVDIRLAARGSDASNLIEEGQRIVGRLLGSYIFGAEDAELASVVVALLQQRRSLVVTAESCTGGLIANRITNVPGASEILCYGLVTYSNEAKRELLGVTEETLAAHGAVSEAVAREMAEGARARYQADYGLAVTGIAGPSGGTPQKPVGRVYIALASKERTVVLEKNNPYDRETFKYVTSQQALELLRRGILK